MVRYEIKERENGLVIEGIADFDPGKIFGCGQCFRWEQDPDGSCTGIAHGMPVTVSYEEETRRLTIVNTDRQAFDEFWKGYLDLDRDYEAIRRGLVPADPVMARAAEFGRGIRILNQEKWETLLTFLISQNNNMTRIRGCIEALAQTLGEPAGLWRGRRWYTLPGPERLAMATEEDLAPCRLGYRARYLIAAGRKALEDGPAGLERLAAPAPGAGQGPCSTEQTLQALQEYEGVGPKVAACIALFSMGRMDCFPLDVWMKRVMHRLYGFREKDTAGMEAYARERYGQYAGLAQQYLFYYATHCGEF